MDLTLTLSSAEVAALESRRQESDKDLAAVVHRMLEPVVRADSKSRLDFLVERYRTLDPDTQIEAVDILRTWIASKQQVEPEPAR